MSGVSAVPSEVQPQRFEPNIGLAWRQVILIAALAGAVLAGLDYFKLALAHSFIRTAGVALGAFGLTLVLFWLKFARYGCQTVVLDDQALTLESKQKREVLRWNEIAEIILVGDSVMKFKSSKPRDALRLDNTGFEVSQWSAIKEALESRGFEFKIGYSAL